MQRRPRKEFATGARTLRGGKNHYTAKTLCGNWVEAQYDPEFEMLARESKFDPKYTSTSATDQKEGIGIVPPEFGAGMEQYEREAADKAGQTTYLVTDWESVNASTFHATDRKNEFSATKHATGGMAPLEGEVYRSRWTSEGPGLRDRRFTTTNDFAAEYQASEYRRKPTRTILGVPNGVTKLRASLVFHHGTDSAAELWRSFPGSFHQGADSDMSVDKQQLIDGLVRFLGGLKITSGAPVSPETQLGLAVGELDSVVRYFDTTGSGYVSVKTFVRCLIGELPDQRMALVRDTFARLKGAAGQGSGGGLLENAEAALAQFYRGSQMRFWSSFINAGDGSMAETAFCEFYQGVSMAIVADDVFARTLAQDWVGIADPLKTTSPYERVRRVRVTTQDGKVLTETIVVDTAAAQDARFLRTMYLARGIAVKSVVYDKSRK